MHLPRIYMQNALWSIFTSDMHAAKLHAFLCFLCISSFYKFHNIHNPHTEMRYACNACIFVAYMHIENTGCIMHARLVLCMHGCIS